MNPFDILVVVILLYCLIRGIFSGLIQEVAAIVGVFGGLYAALAFYRLPAHTFAPWVADPTIANVLGFAAIFIGVWGAVALLGTIIRQALAITRLKWVDWVLGGLFGLVKAVLVITILVIALTTFLPPQAPLVRQSRLAPYINTVSREMIRIIPQDIRRAYRERIKRYESQWKQRT